jgi:hypothetical protein
MYKNAGGWIDKVGAVVLIIIFFPVGLCGLIYTGMSISALPDAGPDPFYVYAFGGFAFVCLIVGGFVVYRAFVALYRK